MALPQKGVEDLLVDKHAIETCEVIKRVVDFDDLAQDPEGLLLRQTAHQLTSDEVQTLEVADLRVPLGVRFQHVVKPSFFVLSLV